MSHQRSYRDQLIAAFQPNQVGNIFRSGRSPLVDNQILAAEHKRRPPDTQRRPRSMRTTCRGSRCSATGSPMNAHASSANCHITPILSAGVALRKSFRPPSSQSRIARICFVRSSAIALVPRPVAGRSRRTPPGDSAEVDHPRLLRAEQLHELAKERLNEAFENLVVIDGCGHGGDCFPSRSACQAGVVRNPAYRG